MENNDCFKLWFDLEYDWEHDNKFRLPEVFFTKWQKIQSKVNFNQILKELNADSFSDFQMKLKIFMCKYFNLKNPPHQFTLNKDLQFYRKTMTQMFGNYMWVEELLITPYYDEFINIDYQNNVNLFKNVVNHNLEYLYIIIHGLNELLTSNDNINVNTLKIPIMQFSQNPKLFNIANNIKPVMNDDLKTNQLNQRFCELYSRLGALIVFNKHDENEPFTLEINYFESDNPIINKALTLLQCDFDNNYLYVVNRELNKIEKFNNLTLLPIKPKLLLNGFKIITK
jgi:hypothetical protein